MKGEIQMSRNAMRLLLLAVLFAFTLTGCIPSLRGDDDSAFDEAEVRNAIEDVLQTFEKAIEDYNISETNGSLSCLSGSKFELEISENSFIYSKTYDQLKSELEADEANQLSWRDEESYGYALDLELGLATFTKINKSAAILTQGFKVYESAANVPGLENPRLTDQGKIIWEFEEKGGDWFALKMRIEYEAVGFRGAGIGLLKNIGRLGFGFGVGPLELR